MVKFYAQAILRGPRVSFSARLSVERGPETGAYNFPHHVALLPLRPLQDRRMPSPSKPHAFRASGDTIL